MVFWEDVCDPCSLRVIELLPHQAVERAGLRRRGRRRRQALPPELPFLPRPDAGSETRVGDVRMALDCEPVYLSAYMAGVAACDVL